MEAKDTVMDITEFRTNVHTLGSPKRQLEELCENIAKAQAEISFKAGYDEGWATAQVYYGIDTG